MPLYSPLSHLRRLRCLQPLVLLLSSPDSPDVLGIKGEAAGGKEEDEDVDIEVRSPLAAAAVC